MLEVGLSKIEFKITNCCSFEPDPKPTEMVTLYLSFHSVGLTGTYLLFKFTILSLS